MKRRQKKRALSLIEIMIVIFIITMITGVIGYNMKGSLDKGKKFRTEQAILQLEDLLQLAISEGSMTPEQIRKNPEKALTNLGLAKHPDKLVVDGWGDKLTIDIQGKDVVVSSKNLAQTNAKNIAPNTSSGG